METSPTLPTQAHRIAVTVVFTLTCFSVPVLSAPAADHSPATPAAHAVAASGVVAGSSSGSATSDTGDGPNWTVGPLADEVRSIQQTFKQQQKDLLQKWRDSVQIPTDTSRDERDKVRAQLKDDLKVKLDDLLEKQKELRAEIAQRFDDHRELIDAAREKVKDTTRQRRGAAGD